MKDIIMSFLIAAAQLLFGIATNIPGVWALNKKIYKYVSPGTVSARYCYSVWLRHLSMVQKAGLSTNPGVVAELGPGNSIGIGLAALISGAEQYYGLDVVKYANTERNLKIFDDLVQLFTNRTPIPDPTEFPEVQPCIDSYEFPHDIMTEERLSAALKPDRLDRIRASIAGSNDQKIVQYAVPYYEKNIMKPDSVDMIYSQAVLEHVEDLETTYKMLNYCLKPGGIMTHVVDFRSHSTAWKWNGQLAYSDFIWKLIFGKRPYLVNRMVYSEHLHLLESNSFVVQLEKKVENYSGVSREKLSPRFQHIANDDLVCQSVFILSSKVC